MATRTAGAGRKAGVSARRLEENTDMKTSRRAGRALGLVGAGAAVLLLAGCNPTSAEPYTPPTPGWSSARWQYEGPSDAWVEATATGVDGYQAEILAAVWVPDYEAPNQEQRQCKSATDRGVEVDCNMGYAEFPNTNKHRADLDEPDTYWPMILLHPGEQVQINVYCKQGGVSAVCPSDTTVHVQTVDGEGNLVGDLNQVDLAGRPLG
jgi:hypothetical protein